MITIKKNKLPSYLETSELINNFSEDEITVPEKYDLSKYQSLEIKNNEDFYHIFDALRFYMVTQLPDQIYDYVYLDTPDLSQFKDFFYEELKYLLMGILSKNRILSEIIGENSYINVLKCLIRNSSGFNKNTEESSVFRSVVHGHFDCFKIMIDNGFYYDKSILLFISRDFNRDKIIDYLDNPQFVGMFKQFGSNNGEEIIFYKPNPINMFDRYKMQTSWIEYMNNHVDKNDMGEDVFEMYQNIFRYCRNLSLIGMYYDSDWPQRVSIYDEVEDYETGESFWHDKKNNLFFKSGGSGDEEFNIYLKSYKNIDEIIEAYSYIKTKKDSEVNKKKKNEIVHSLWTYHGFEQYNLEGTIKFYNYLIDVGAIGGDKIER